MFWLKACQRCGGDLYLGLDIHGPYVSCLQCARELSVAEVRALLERSWIDQPEDDVIQLVPVRELARVA